MEKNYFANHFYSIVTKAVGLSKKKAFDAVYFYDMLTIASSFSEKETNPFQIKNTVKFPRIILHFWTYLLYRKA